MPAPDFSRISFTIAAVIAIIVFLFLYENFGCGFPQPM